MSAAPQLPAWDYQPPYRPTGYEEQCYYRSGRQHTARPAGSEPEAPELGVFRFANRTTVDLRIEHNAFTVSARLDAAAIRHLWAALGDVLADITPIEADRERSESFDRISEEMREAEENGYPLGVYYAHPDVHYVPPEQLAAKVAELEAAGCKRFMVLPDPASATAEAAA